MSGRRGKNRLFFIQLIFDSFASNLVTDSLDRSSFGGACCTARYFDLWLVFHFSFKVNFTLPSRVDLFACSFISTECLHFQNTVTVQRYGGCCCVLYECLQRAERPAPSKNRLDGIFYSTCSFRLSRLLFNWCHFSMLDALIRKRKCDREENSLATWRLE